MRTIAKILILFAAVFLLTHCSKSSSSSKEKPFFNILTTLSETELEICRSANEFGFNLFREIAAWESVEHPGENLFVSSLSVSYCLGMVLNAASGETQQEMLEALEISEFSLQEINESYRRIMSLLPEVDPEVTIAIANSMWANFPSIFDPYFANTCRDFFGARVEEIDFFSPTAAAIINEWVKNNTKGKIDEIISQSELEEYMWVALNAIYFKGDWADKFDREDTHADLFHLSDGNTVPCRMMAQELDCGYWNETLFEGVDLPYSHGAFSMAVLLPRSPFTADDLIMAVDGDSWDAWLNSASYCEVFLELPKFEFDYEVDLKECLIVLGMVKAFWFTAEFESMFYPPVSTWIDMVRHKAYVRVDEEGTEAAAVTGAVGEGGFPAVLKVDRPFVFVIHEEVTGLILFMGKVEEPLW